MAEAQTSLDHCKKEKSLLEDQITEILPEEEDHDSIVKRRDGIEQETKVKEKELKQLRSEIETINTNLDKGEKKLQKNAALIGNAVGLRDQHEANVKERENLAESALTELNLEEHSGGDISQTLKREEQKIKNQVKVLKAENRDKEAKVDEEIDQLKSKKTGLEEGKRREQTELVANKKEIALMKRQLNDLEGAAEKLAKIKSDW